MVIALGILFVLVLLLEGTVFALPLVLIVLLSMMIYFQSDSVLFFAFLAGLVLDVMLLRTVGLTSLFLVIFLSLIALYDKKFEVDSVYFAVFATLLGASVYLLFFGSSAFIWQIGLSLVFSVLLFKVVIRFKPQE